MKQLEKQEKLRKMVRLLVKLLVCTIVAIFSLILAKQRGTLCVWLFTATFSIGAFFLLIATNVAENLKKKRDEEEGLMLAKAIGCAERRKQCNAGW